MKIIFIIDSLTNSGTEKSLLDTLSNFSKNVEPIIVYLHSPNTLLPFFETLDIRVISIDENRKHSILFYIKKFKKIVDEIKPDIIVSSLFLSNIVARIVCKLTHTKLIGTFVSDSYSLMRWKNLRFKQKIGLFFVMKVDRITSNIPVAFISNSKSIKLSNCQKLFIPKNKVKVIYRGRDEQQINSWVEPINKDYFIFIIIARVLKTKGYSELIDAFKIVLKKHSNIELHIYGDGNYASELKNKCIEKGIEKAIDFKGNILNAHQYLDGTNCFIFPSWYEGLSGALIEASISGIPIIASNILMNIEVLQGFRNVILHKVKNTESIADSMLQMIDNYDVMVSYANETRNAAIEKFAIKTIAKKYEELLQSQITKH